MSNFNFALSPNISRENQMGWPLKDYFIKRGMILKWKLAEIKWPENRFYYFHSNTSSSDLWPKNLLMMKRRIKGLPNYPTIVYFNNYSGDNVNGRYQFKLKFPWTLKKNHIVNVQPRNTSFSGIFSSSSLNSGVSCHFPDRNGGQHRRWSWSQPSPHKDSQGLLQRGFFQTLGSLLIHSSESPKATEYFVKSPRE